MILSGRSEFSSSHKWAKNLEPLGNVHIIAVENTVRTGHVKCCLVSPPLRISSISALHFPVSSKSMEKREKRECDDDTDSQDWLCHFVYLCLAHFAAIPCYLLAPIHSRPASARFPSVKPCRRPQRVQQIRALYININIVVLFHILPSFSKTTNVNNVVLRCPFPRVHPQALPQHS